VWYTGVTKCSVKHQCNINVCFLTLVTEKALSADTGYLLSVVF